MREAASHAAKGGRIDRRFRSAYTRSQWFRQNYRSDMTEDEKLALVVEYHQGTRRGEPMRLIGRDGETWGQTPPHP